MKKRKKMLMGGDKLYESTLANPNCSSWPKQSRYGREISEISTARQSEGKNLPKKEIYCRAIYEKNLKRKKSPQKLMYGKAICEEEKKLNKIP